MKEKILSDIRVYKSNIPNIDGNALPSSIDNKKLNIVLHRIVMKLRENEFALGAFDHLYLNFTVCLDKEMILPAGRRPDPYHPWYRYYDIGVNAALYQALDSEQSIDQLISFVEKALLQYFVVNKETERIIKSSVLEAVTLKENMLMKYKTKETASRKAVVYLRYLDTGYYFPLLCVYDADGTELLKKDLSVSRELNAFGTMQLSNKKVTIKPRANVFTTDLKPMSFDF